jgi:hypothetical protein
MAMSKNTIPMPVKVKPYAHQQNAFDFVCGLFGLTTFEETSSGAALLMEMGTGKSSLGNRYNRFFLPASSVYT